MYYGCFCFSCVSLSRTSVDGTVYECVAANGGMGKGSEEGMLY